MPNYKGTRKANLIASHPENRNAGTHGVWSERMREPRVRELTEAILSAPWADALDEVGAGEIAKVIALVEALDAAIAERGVIGSRGDVRHLVEIRLSASRTLASWLDRFALTPRGRAEVAQTLAGAESLASAIRRRREAA